MVGKDLIKVEYALVKVAELSQLGKTMYLCTRDGLNALLDFP